MSDQYLELLLKAKDDEIERLLVQNKELQEKILALLDPQALAAYKHHTAAKKDSHIRRPMIFDEKKKVLREKTDSEISEEFKALQELGVC